MDKQTAKAHLQQVLERALSRDTHAEARDQMMSLEEQEALLVAIQVLHNSKGRSALTGLPNNAGAPWSKDEEATLVERFLAGDTPHALAATHGRTTGAIKARLVKIGMVVDDELLPSIAAPQSVSQAEHVPQQDAVPASAPDGNVHKHLIGMANYPLKVKSTEVFQPGEVEVLRRYGFWMEALATGRVQPATPAQEHFCHVCRGEVKPETLYERAWLRLMGRRAIEPELVREFDLRDPGEEWFQREAHWR